jgi:hypothetical protein
MSKPRIPKDQISLGGFTAYPSFSIGVSTQKAPQNGDSFNYIHETQNGPSIVSKATYWETKNVWSLMRLVTVGGSK